MIKLLFILISMISSFTYGKQNYNLIMYKIDYNYTIIGEVSNYLLVNENGHKMIGANGYEHKFVGLSNGKIIEANSQIYVLGFLNNSFCVYIFSKHGQFIEQKTLCESIIYNYQVHVINNQFLISGYIKNYQDSNLKIEAKNKGLNGDDIIIYQFDSNFNELNHNLIGGKLNESILDATILDGSLFFVGNKDKETGGDLGYGGLDHKTVFIASLNENLEIENYLVLDKKITVQKLFNYENHLYLSTNENLYCLNKELNFIENMKFLEEVKYSKLSFDGKLVTLSYSKGYVYDVINMSLLESFNYPENFSLYEINFFLENENYILCEYDNDLVLIDIVFMKDTKISDVYTKDTDEVAVKTVFGKAVILEKKEEYYFDPLICGNYPFEYLMEAKNGLEFSFKTLQTIPLEINVLENGVYPLGYNLRFTGKAYLNGEIVINNYPLNISGNYSLILKDNNNNNEKKINFTVSEYQRKISDQFQDYFHYEIEKDESLEINFSIENLEEEIIGFKVNGKIVESFNINNDDKKVSIKINDFNELGYHLLYIESMLFKKDNLLYEDFIKEYYYVNVNPKKPTFEVNFLEDGSLNVEVEDSDNSLRSLRFYLYNNKEEYFYDFPIHNIPITISGFSEGLYDFNLMLGYNSGGEIKYTEALITGKIQGDKNELYFGNLRLLNNYEAINKFSIKVDDAIVNKELKELNYLKTNIFLNNDFSYLPVIIFSLAIGTIIIFSILIWRKKKTRKVLIK